LAASTALPASPALPLKRRGVTLADHVPPEEHARKAVRMEPPPQPAVASVASPADVYRAAMSSMQAMAAAHKDARLERYAALVAPSFR
jgi:hypothetical protein